MNRIATREELMQDTLEADTNMLLQYLTERTRWGNVTPITTREALEAIHRNQPADGLNVMDAAHVERVMARVRGILTPPAVPGRE